MIRARSPFANLLAGLLTVLLTVPAAVSVHHHEADHDGDTVHLEVPHGGHHSPAPELYERVTSAPPHGPVAHAAATAPLNGLPSLVRIVAEPEDIGQPRARPPPGPKHPRAPPTGS